jgi:tRNA 2-thiouridine synthesizing protein A
MSDAARIAEAAASGEGLPVPRQVLDTVGLYCPVPIIKTAERIRQMVPGEILEVLSDDRVILIDMPAWCRSKGHEYLGYFERHEEMHLLVRKVGRAQRAGGGRG